MFNFFGMLSPATGRPVASDEAPLKRSFFGSPVDPAAVPPAEADALYLAGKQPEPADRRPQPWPRT